jgi:hypothetical protein
MAFQKFSPRVVLDTVLGIAKQRVMKMPGNATPLRFSIPAVLLVCLFLYRAPSQKITGVSDPDYWWHIEYGRWILEHGALPVTDAWSWTAFGKNYLLTQWLGETAMGFAFNLANTAGTGVLAALLLTLTVAASYRAARCYLDNRLAAFFIALFCDAILLTLVARPHNFTHLALALLSWILASWDNDNPRGNPRGNPRALYWLPPLFALWANLHGGFAFGLAYLALVWISILLSAYVKRERPALLPLTTAIALSAFATLLNPYGIGAWMSVLDISNLQSTALDIITEWKATSIKDGIGQQFFCVLAAMLCAVAASRQKPTLANLLVVTALLAIGWKAARLSMMVSILMVPYLARSFGATPLHDLAFSGNARKHDRQIGWIPALAMLAIVALPSWLHAKSDARTQEQIRMSLPVEETAFIQRHGLAGRVLNDMEIGGHLIHHGIPVAIDTRLDLYGDRAFFEFQFARAGRAGWADYVSRLNPDIVLMKLDAPLVHLLATYGGYRPVMSNGVFALLLKEGVSNFPAIPLPNPDQAFLETLGTPK